MCHELANLTRWVYKIEPQLWITPEEAIRSSEGTQHGRRLSNSLFPLAMQYIVEKIQDITATHHIVFCDDNNLIGTPEALAKAAHIINEMADDTGLRLRWG